MLSNPVAIVKTASFGPLYYSMRCSIRPIYFTDIFIFAAISMIIVLLPFAQLKEPEWKNAHEVYFVAKTLDSIRDCYPVAGAAELCKGGADISSGRNLYPALVETDRLERAEGQSGSISDQRQNPVHAQ